MIWEVHYTRHIEADNFFDAVEKAKEDFNEIEEVISVCPFVEEDIILND